MLLIKFDIFFFTLGDKFCLGLWSDSSGKGEQNFGPLHLNDCSSEVRQVSFTY